MTTWAELTERSVNAPPGSTAYERMLFGSLSDDSFDALVDLSTSNPGSTAWVHLRDSLIGVTQFVVVAHTVARAVRDFTIDAANRGFIVSLTSRLFSIVASRSSQVVKQKPRDRAVVKSKRSQEEGPDVF